MVKTLSILSVGVADVVYDEIEHDISKAIRERRKLVIMYASMHILNLAHDDANLRNALSSADVVHPDGIGVWLSARYLYGNGFCDRFNWTDHASEFLEQCAERNWRIFLLGSTTENLDRAVHSLRREIPQIRIVGVKNGYDDIESADLIDVINAAHPDILWVGMGAPKQELWIHHHRNQLQCSVIQSVGDVITFFAGDKIRGPKIFQLLGLEWAFRVLIHPGKYFSRYAVGIPLFVARIVKQRFRF
jgi:N-acetylglucosaminyldiphosphoundecaprenol N-acetyl-beta-D-mannosaminyltransferase